MERKGGCDDVLQQPHLFDERRDDSQCKQFEDEKSYILSAGDSYTIVTPSLAGGELSGGFKWEMPTSDVGAYGWYLYNEHIEGTIPNSFTTLSQTVSAVPEPSTYAAIFGAVALGFAAYHRRK